MPKVPELWDNDTDDSQPSSPLHRLATASPTGKQKAAAAGQRSVASTPVKVISTYALLDDHEDYHTVRKLRRSRFSARRPEVPSSLRQIWIDFCSRTSSHGVPHIGASTSIIGKLFWLTIFIICSSAFTYQTYRTIARYMRFDKTIEMELKFEPAPFPAVTVCNLNPYKASEVLNNPVLRATMELYDYAIMKEKRPTPPPVRSRRSAFLEPLYVLCKCLRPTLECIPLRDPYETAYDKCLCFQEKTSGSIWPCYHVDRWTRERCVDCSFSGSCLYPRHLNDHPVGSNQLPQEHDQTVPCLCQNVSNSCIIDRNTPIAWWEPFEYVTHYQPPTTTEPSITTTPDVKKLQAMGIEEMDDEIAITNMARESLIFAVGGLDDQARINLSYTKEEFILKCSFNGEQCSIANDFQLHLDPVYGNCYVFNFNHTVRKLNSRAGPMYVSGLRLLLNVNQTDYLTLTEMAGVRINVHNQTQTSFPDTFGYSAPTGFMSSFGLKSHILIRLSEPYGHCLEDLEGKTEAYIYTDGLYSTEGCYRSCFQKYIVSRCHCGDPRFPQLPGYTSCEADDNEARTCIRNISAQVGDFYRLQSNCSCIQPCFRAGNKLLTYTADSNDKDNWSNTPMCPGDIRNTTRPVQFSVGLSVTESIYQVTYSAATWPADNHQVGNCEFIGDNSTTSCTEYYRKHTAFVEIYYEQLNYEFLREKEAYGTESLLADFGGNIGLWIGFSAITMVEFIILFVEIAVYCCGQDSRRRRRPPKRRRQKKGDNAHSSHVNTYSNEPGRSNQPLPPKITMDDAAEFSIGSSV